MVSTTEIKKYIKQQVSDELYQHILGTAETAAELAEKQGINRSKAYTAGLLHDIAREKDKKDLLAVLNGSGWEVDDVEKQLGELLHAPASAVLAENELGIKDREILEAVRWHTVGGPEMSVLARIIFLADMIEPGRDFPGVKELRKKTKHNFKTALIAACDSSLKYNINQRKVIHPGTLLLRNSLLKGESKNGNNT